MSKNLEIFSGSEYVNSKRSNFLNKMPSQKHGDEVVLNIGHHGLFDSKFIKIMTKYLAGIVWNS